MGKAMNKLLHQSLYQLMLLGLFVALPLVQTFAAGALFVFYGRLTHSVAPHSIDASILWENLFVSILVSFVPALFVVQYIHRTIQAGSLPKFKVAVGMTLFCFLLPIFLIGMLGSSSTPSSDYLLASLLVTLAVILTFLLAQPFIKILFRLSPSKGAIP